MADIGIDWEACRQLSREQFDAIFGNVKMDGPTDPHPKSDKLWWPNGAPKRGPVAPKTFSPPYDGPCQVCGRRVEFEGFAQSMCPPCRAQHMEITQAQFEADLEREWV